MERGCTYKDALGSNFPPPCASENVFCETTINGLYNEQVTGRYVTCSDADRCNKIKLSGIMAPLGFPEYTVQDVTSLKCEQCESEADAKIDSNDACYSGTNNLVSCNSLNHTACYQTVSWYKSINDPAM